MLGGAAGTYSVDLEDGNGNVIIGSYSHTSATDSEYQIVFGFNVVGNGDNTLTFGNAGADVSCAFSGTTWSNPSDERIKKDIETSTLGLSFINDLRPVTFKFKTKGELPESHSDYVEDSTESFQDEKIHHGYIAQEVKEAMDRAGDSGKDGFEGWGLNTVNDFQRVGEGAFVGTAAASSFGGDQFDAGSHEIPKGVTIYGRWSSISVQTTGMKCICYMG